MPRLDRAWMTTSKSYNKGEASQVTRNRHGGGSAVVRIPNDLGHRHHREFDGSIALVFDVFTKPGACAETFAPFGGRERNGLLDRPAPSGGKNYTTSLVTMTAPRWLVPWAPSWRSEVARPGPSRRGCSKGWPDAGRAVRRTLPRGRATLCADGWPGAGQTATEHRRALIRTAKFSMRTSAPSTACSHRRDSATADGRGLRPGLHGGRWSRLGGLRRP